MFLHSPLDDNGGRPVERLPSLARGWVLFGACCCDPLFAPNAVKHRNVSCNALL